MTSQLAAVYTEQPYKLSRRKDQDFPPASKDPMLIDTRDHFSSRLVFINPFTLRAAKRGLTILEIFPLQKHFLENI